MKCLKAKVQNMKIIRLRLNSDPTHSIKETPEQRNERVQQAGSSMRTRIVPNKKNLTIKQQRQLNKKLIGEIDD